MIVDHGRIHCVCVVAHKWAIPALRDDYLCVGYMDNLWLLVRLSLTFLVGFAATTTVLLASIGTLAHCTAALLSLPQIGHRGLLLLHSLADSIVELG